MRTQQTPVFREHASNAHSPLFALRGVPATSAQRVGEREREGERACAHVRERTRENTTGKARVRERERE